MERSRVGGEEGREGWREMVDERETQWEWDETVRGRREMAGVCGVVERVSGRQRVGERVCESGRESEGERS